MSNLNYHFQQNWTFHLLCILLIIFLLTGPKAPTAIGRPQTYRTFTSLFFILLMRLYQWSRLYLSCFYNKNIWSPGLTVMIIFHCHAPQEFHHFISYYFLYLAFMPLVCSLSRLHLPHCSQWISEAILLYRLYGDNLICFLTVNIHFFVYFSCES